MNKRLWIPCAALVAAACTRATVAAVPAGEPYVRGVVESFTHHATASNLLVRAGPGSREACGIAATVDARTRYLERGQTGGTRVIERASVTAGDTVEVYVRGAVAESCPAQGYADAVVRAAR